MNLDIIVLGVIAVAAFLMLRSVLGKKSGNEEERARSRMSQRQDQLRAKLEKRAGKGAEKAGQRPLDTQSPEAHPVEPMRASSIDEFAEIGSPLAQALTEIQLADSSFDPGHFMAGAKAAYEMIVTAFAAGDKKALKPLLSDAVFGGFSGVIDARATAGEKIEQTFIGINAAKITDAALTGGAADISVKFVTELISTTKNADGAVIQGDPNHVYRVTDIWTFSRDTASGDPTWRVTATKSG